MACPFAWMLPPCKKSDCPKCTSDAEKPPDFLVDAVQLRLKEKLAAQVVLRRTAANLV